MSLNTKFSVVTTSLLINYYLIYPLSSLPKEFSIQNGSSFENLSLFSSLIQKNTDNLDGIIFIQV
jgi:hypothetical protein